MILRRYGASYHSVEPNFNPASMTEIGFLRDRVFSLSAGDFEDAYERLETGELAGEADGDVQREAERAVLEALELALQGWVERLKERQVLVILNARSDWPKTRERRETVPANGDNRLHFYWWINPPLRVAIYHPVRP